MGNVRSNSGNMPRAVDRRSSWRPPGNHKNDKSPGASADGLASTKRLRPEGSSVRCAKQREVLLPWCPSSLGHGQTDLGQCQYTNWTISSKGPKVIRKFFLAASLGFVLFLWICKHFDLLHDLTSLSQTFKIIKVFSEHLLWVACLTCIWLWFYLASHALLTGCGQMNFFDSTSVASTKGFLTVAGQLESWILSKTGSWSVHEEVGPKVDWHN